MKTFIYFTERGGNTMFKVTLVTDEVSSDFETAVELAAGWGIRNVEIRGVGDERIGAHSDYTADHIKTVIKNYGVNVSSVSPGLFKTEHHQPTFEGWTVLKWQDRYEFEKRKRLEANIDRQLSEVLPRTIDFCQSVNCSNILMFSFNMPEGSSNDVPCPDYLMHYFTEACSMAKSAGMNLLMENEHICYGNTVENTRRLIEQIGFDNLKLNWDPGNAYFSHENPFPEAYDKIKDIIGHVHMKDAITKADGSMEYVVKGVINWEGQIQALMDLGFDGYLAIETHCRPKVKSAYDTLQRIISIAGKDVL